VKQSTPEGYCREMNALVAACDQDDPSPVMTQAIEDHIQHCALCQHAEEALSTTLNQLRAVTPGGVSPGFEATLIARLCQGADDRRDSSS
jgi:hypothetical protein